jgi:hypothetical protein
VRTYLKLGRFLQGVRGGVRRLDFTILSGVEGVAVTSKAGFGAAAEADIFVGI